MHRLATRYEENRNLMRLDKFLCRVNLGTRSQVKEYIRKGLITVNGTVCTRPEQKINEITDTVCFQEKPLIYKQFVYYMLNKPGGVVSATRDSACKTVLDLISCDEKSGIFPVGRLDKDTEGLLFLTNDGALAHMLLSPRKHVDKTYLVTLAHSLSTDDVTHLEGGVDIGEDKPTLPAKVKILSELEVLLTIQEGKFHQVKRMFTAVGNCVVHLKRISFGPLSLDETLRPGEYRVLTEKEIHALYEGTNAQK